MIYTGPVDEFFEYRYGKLPYRSLKFEFETVNQEWVQPVAVVNYPNEHLYTRVTEFKHLTGQEHRKSSLVYEYPLAEGDPYYPVPRPENNELYKKYQALAEDRSDVQFVGRLATYKYYNMDQVVAQALSVYARIVGQKRSEATRAEAPRPAAPTVLTPRIERRAGPPARLLAGGARPPGRASSPRPPPCARGLAPPLPRERAARKGEGDRKSGPLGAWRATPVRKRRGRKVGTAGRNFRRGIPVNRRRTLVGGIPGGVITPK